MSFSPGGGGVIKRECVINALCLSDLRFSLVCVQEETWGHYSCGCLDKRLNVSVYNSKRKGDCIYRGILNDVSRQAVSIVCLNGN